jgi:hypothetical protein
MTVDNYNCPSYTYYADYVDGSLRKYIVWISLAKLSFSIFCESYKTPSHDECPGTIERPPQKYQLSRMMLCVKCKMYVLINSPLFCLKNTMANINFQTVHTLYMLNCRLTWFVFTPGIRTGIYPNLIALEKLSKKSYKYPFVVNVKRI